MKNRKKFPAYLSVAVFMIFMIVIHAHYVCQYDDLALIRDTLKPSILDEFYSVIYNFTSWSSRVLVNLPIHIMLHLPYGVWMVLQNVMWMALVTSICYIFIDREQIEWTPYYVLILLLFSFYMEMTAGWVVTTMTYIWPMAMGTVALTQLKRWQKGLKNKWYHYLLYSLLVIYAANQEQMCIVLCLLFGSCTIYSLIKKKWNGVLYSETFFAVANLVLHMVTPGNENRNLQSMAAYFPSYGTLSIVDKLELGFSSTLYNYVFDKSRLLFVLTFLLACVVWQKRKSWLHRILGVIPFAMQLFFGYFMGWILQSHLHIFVFGGHLNQTGVITEYNYFEWKEYVPLLIMLFFGVSLVMALYIALGDTFQSIFAIILLFGSLGARMIVALSSTVWESGVRTYMVFEYALILLSLLLFSKYDMHQNKKANTVIFGVLCFFALVSMSYTFRTI